MGLICSFHKFGVVDYAMSGASADVFASCGLDVETMVKNLHKLL
jgi:transketolase